jgi:hypothetical protein
MGKLRGKRIVIFVVGVAKESSENKKHFILKNIPKEYWKNVVVFYCVEPSTSKGWALLTSL